jgi:hypothetical protein
MHMVGPVLGDKAAYDKMLSTFVNAVRSNRKATIDDLFAAIEAYYQTTMPEWRETVRLLLYTRGEAKSLIERIAQGERYRDELDPAVPCLVALVWDIGQRLGSFIIVHDNSRVVARHALTLLSLNELPNPTRPGRLLSPLPIVTIEFSDSKEVPQLQLADWIAGAGRQWATELVLKRGDEFAEQLGPIVNEWLIGGAWPDPETIGHPKPRTIP